MEKNKKLIILCSSLFCLTIALFTVISIKNIDVSYALQTNSDGIPTQNFRTNASSSNPTTINLVGDALSGNASYNSNTLATFKVVSNLRDADGVYPLYTLSKNKLVPTSSELFEVGSEYNNPTDVNDLMISRILQVGYSNLNNEKTVFNRADLKNRYGTVTDNVKKEYITQLAIWVLLYEYKNSYSSSYCANNACVFYQEDGTDNPAAISYETVRQAINDAASNNNYKYLGYVNELVDEGKDALNIATTGNPYDYSNLLGNYTYYKDGNNEYILTGEFKLSHVDAKNFISWNVSVLDPNNYGIYITDTNGGRLTNLNNLSENTVIRLHIPLSEDRASMNLNKSGIKVTINSLNITEKIHIFRVTHTDNGNLLLGSGGTKEERFSNTLLGLTKTISNDVDFTLHNFTVISKVDATNGEEIAGAHLVIYNASDINSDTKLPNDSATAIAEWDSVEGQSYKISLDDGDYGLCETIAPENYERVTTCVTFAVNNSQAVTVYTLENVPVPNTGVFNSKISYTIGGSLVIIGILGMILVLGKDKKNKKQQSEQQESI